ncbi:MAG: flotillin family protein [Planctomycetes bacterium]|nr:flotillin family protein [Planctomycetota bacterium]
MWDLVAIIAGIVIVFLIGLGVFLNAFYRKVDQGYALIVNKLKTNPEVTFTGAMVLPVIHRTEVMDISLKTIEVDRNGTNGLICKDNIRADIKVTFFVRVNKTVEDVLKVAGSVGVLRASDPRTLEELFQAKFSEALKTVGKKMEFVDLYNERDEFKDQIIQLIGRELNGYNLEDAAIDYLEQTPLKMLDPDNILDSEGRKKIIDLTSQQRVKANEISREAEKVIKKQDVETREVILALERQQAEAEAKQHREIGTTQARETAEQQRVEAEEHRRAETARIAVSQDLGVAREKADREIQVAGKNREGAVAVENERIQKERMLEAVQRERAVELSQIEKEKILAVERKNIAEVIRERVAVEKTVAEEEERIKDVRVIAEAKRQREVAITRADQEAEQAKIKEVKHAQAGEIAAGHRAKERLVLAEADQGAAEKEAVASMRRAEGKQAESAAAGLGHARVLEAEAEANRKRGMAELSVRDASAKAIELVGKAEASAVENRMMAESRGLTEKAAAMAKLTEASRGHEEFRMRLEKEVEVAKERIHASVTVAQENGRVLSESLKNAKFEIVGGDGEFFERYAKAISVGKGIDATVEHSTVLQHLGREYLSGDRSLPEDLKQTLSGLGQGGGIKDAALGAMLTRWAMGQDPAKVQSLLAQVRQLGFAEHVAAPTKP